jgi:hypothetical protein
MKYVLSVVAVVVMMAGAAKADGNVSSSMLAKMGLSGMQVMSDVQGTTVRGMGYYHRQNVVAGVSYASAGYASAGGAYYAAGNNFAAGASVSHASSNYYGKSAFNATASVAY